jgi:molybdopterin-guanine dinucleotide biosynthesis protein MobB
MIDYPLPLLGFSAFSGTGKTTLLTRLLPLLKAEGLRIGVVKHAHHLFELDHPHKDSYELRQAGADQMLVASRKRIAWVAELPDNRKEPTLQQALSVLDARSLDLVLVEGFKREPFSKIELHRPSMGRPLLFPNDPNIIAVASDAPLPAARRHLPLLDLNRPDDIVMFILNHLLPTREHRADDQQHHSHRRQLR